MFGIKTKATKEAEVLKGELEALKEAFDSIRGEVAGWTSLSDIQGANTDLSFENQVKQVEKARQAFFYSPAGKRMVRYTTAYIMGKGFNIASENEAVNYILDEFIKNPKNKWKTQTKEWANRLQTDGEVFPTLFVGNDGSVLARETNPVEITEILTHPEDVASPILYKREYLKITYAAGEPQEEPRTEYIKALDATEELIGLLNLTDEQRQSIPNSKYIYHVKTITYSDRKRGLSDFSAILYYLARIRKAIDSKQKMNDLKEAFFLDITVDGTPQQIAAEASKQQYKRPPKAGSTLFHNPAIKVDLKQPDLKHDDSNKALEPLMQQIVQGSGMPEWMLVGQANMFKAGAQEQSAPFVKVIEDYQEQWEESLKALFTFIIWKMLNANNERDQLAGTKGIKGLLAQIDDEGFIVSQKMNEQGKMEDETFENSKEVIKKPFWESIEIQFPDIISRDESKEADAVTKDLGNKLCSRRTASGKRDYDYDKEKVYMDLEAAEDLKNNPLMLNDEHITDETKPDDNQDEPDNNNPADNIDNAKP